MANNYTETSKLLEDLTKEELDWLQSECEQRPDVLDDAEMKQWASSRGLNDRGCERWPGFDWEVGRTEKTFLLHGDADLENAANLFRRFLAKFRPGEWIWLTWAQWCDKPRPDEFGGGGFIATAEGVTWFSLGGLIRSELDRLAALGKTGQSS